MKKNLKKVISAVLSLTLALSSFVALSATGSAATFTDVADTASYSEAVEALAALGAIAGYEDGTFLPNNNITRAEVTTMIVAALNMTEDAKNSGSTTQFADVNANAAWAAGYVNIGVAQGFISGMSATEFAPAENVTYAQVLTMLTRILGYGDFAEARGGYPNGYLTAASTAGILSGVSASANDAMTRAQVAQLIWNAVQAPMLDITTFSTSTTGLEMEKMDGKNGRDFKTVLSDKFDAYVLNITVEATSKSSGTLDAGKLNMKLTGSNDWDPDTEQIVSSNTDTQKVKSDVAAGKTAAENYLFSSAKVVAEFNDDDEWTLLYFAPTTKVTQKEVDGTLVSSLTPTELKIKKSKNTTNTTTYKLDSEVEVYVNGSLFCDLSESNAAEVVKIMEGSVGNTVLVEGETSGKYTKIMIDYYVVARVNQITAKSDSTTITIAGFRAPEGVVTVTDAKNSIKINNDDIEDGTLNLSVTKAGAAAELSSLAKDDVIAIKYDIGDASTKSSIENSSFIEIIATTDTVTGQYTSYDDEDELYTVAGAEYEAVYDMTIGTDSLEVGTSYTFKLDPFNRLFSYEVEATSKNFAIVERYVETGSTSSASEYDYIQVMTLDGQSKTLYIDNNYEDTANTILTGMNIQTTVKNTARTVDIKDRIIEYTVKNSSGRVNKITKVTDVEYVPNSEYNSNTNRLGKTLSTTASVLDATDYPNLKENGSASIGDYKASSLAGLVDGVKYEALLVYKSNSEYSYVIVLTAGATFSASSNFVVAAVDAKESSKATVEGEEVYTLEVMKDGASSSSKLNISTTVKVYNGSNTEVPLSTIKQGSAFFYTTDSDGFVDKIAIIFKGQTDFATLYKSDMTSLISYPELGADDNAYTATDWKISLSDAGFEGADNEIQLLLAPVFLETAKSVTVAEVVAGDDNTPYSIDTNKTYDYSITDDTKIYSYDMSGDTVGKNAFSSGSFIGFDTRDVDTNGIAWLGSHGDDYNHEKTIQMALMMVVDGTVTNALVFNQ